MKNSLFFLLIVIAASTSCTQKDERPNVLFIMADDHTTQAISCYGGIFKDFARTENIDRLASEGVRFSNTFCTNSICSPSRAVILTGKYSHKNGIYCLDQKLDTTQFMFHKTMQQSGYNTALFGKWHLKATPGGFDDYKVLKRQGRYQDPEFIEKGQSEMVLHEGWSTDIITQMTIDHINKVKDGDEPFMVMCQYKATHDPWASRAPYDTLWENIELPEPFNLMDNYEGKEEPWNRTTLKLEYMNQSTYPHHRLENATDSAQRRHIYHQYIKSFLRCGRVLDENVGKLLAYLDESGLSENTIVVYTADQGHFLGEHGFFSKRFMYDESLRMPLIVRYPNVIPANTVRDELIVNIDFAPTILDAVGMNTPEEVQGESFWPLLTGSEIPEWRTSLYYRYWQHLLHRNVTAHYGIRNDRYKLIFYYGQALGQTDFPPTEPVWELYDLSKDPYEMNNMYTDAQYQNVIAELKKELTALKVEYEDTDDQYPEMKEVVEHYY